MSSSASCLHWRQHSHPVECAPRATFGGVRPLRLVASRCSPRPSPTGRDPLDAAIGFLAQRERPESRRAAPDTCARAAPLFGLRKSRARASVRRFDEQPSPTPRRTVSIPGLTLNPTPTRPAMNAPPVGPANRSASEHAVRIWNPLITPPRAASTRHAGPVQGSFREAAFAQRIDLPSE